MKYVRLALMTAAFLLLISSFLTLTATTDRTPVYINVAIMVLLALAVGIINFNRSKERDKK